jgi:hypothetical protein
VVESWSRGLVVAHYGGARLPNSLELLTENLNGGTESVLRRLICRLVDVALGRGAELIPEARGAGAVFQRVPTHPDDTGAPFVLTRRP